MIQELAQNQSRGGVGSQADKQAPIQVARGAVNLSPLLFGSQNDFFWDFCFRDELCVARRLTPPVEQGHLSLKAIFKCSKRSHGASFGITHLI
jgi:hypothetical protein